MCYEYDFLVVPADEGHLISINLNWFYDQF